MKSTLTLLALVLLCITAKAQDAAVTHELNCYNKWAQKFEERGAEEVPDGTYTDVIITFRQAAEADCYNGKVIVKDGKVTSFYIELEDGTFEQVIRVWKSDMKDIPITNGISKTIITKDNILVNVLWPKKIKPKKAAFKKAAEPTDD
jgi:hypothetical protein